MNRRQWMQGMLAAAAAIATGAARQTATHVSIAVPVTQDGEVPVYMQDRRGNWRHIGWCLYPGYVVATEFIPAGAAIYISAKTASVERTERIK
jgi:hypothetical protein